MDRFYVAGELGVDAGRVMLGRLQKDKLSISEVRRFANHPVREDKSLHWNIPHLYEELLAGLRELSVYEEPVDGVSCHSWGSDYVLFKPDGSPVSPVFHFDDPRGEIGMEKVLGKLPWESIYDETGVYRLPGNTLFQMAAEKPRRLKNGFLLPIADAFNFLLSGVARSEMSLASATQLFNPVAREWSQPLMAAVEARPELFPQLAGSGTRLGPVRPEIVRLVRLEEARVAASCSNELAAALAGLPVNAGENWAFLRAGQTFSIGAPLLRPIITDESRDLNFTNEMSAGGGVNFYKQAMGFWLVDECKRFWKQSDRDLDDDVLKHLATSAPPFESLINPDDPRFLTAGDMPLKIQAFCRETNQEIPRRPGAILRCVMESLALHYRKALQELEALTGREFSRVYLIGGSSDHLLYHFAANALQIPVTIAPACAASIGNVILQAVAFGHIESLDQAREIVRHSFKFQTITPRASVWNDAYDRLADLAPSC